MLREAGGSGADEDSAPMIGTAAKLRHDSTNPPDRASDGQALGQPGRLRRVVHEPLVHFLLIGAALFAGYHLRQPESDSRDASTRIVVTADDLRQMSVARLAQGRPPPAPEQMRNLVDAWVRDEILFREALALGLDKDDTIVKRRMVQKMEFLAEDLSDLREPTRADLQAWFQRNAERFAHPARITFRHLYFSPDRRGGPAQARAAAEQTMARLARKSAEAADAATPVDPFMFQDHYPDRTPDQIARDFGPGFAGAVFQLAPGSWRGPIESGFGWHVIWVESVMPARVPAFEEVEPDVKSRWIEEQRAESKRRAFEAMRARYEVILPEEKAP